MTEKNYGQVEISFKEFESNKHLSNDCYLMVYLKDHGMPLDGNFCPKFKPDYIYDTLTDRARGLMLYRWRKKHDAR